LDSALYLVKLDILFAVLDSLRIEIIAYNPEPLYLNRSFNSKRANSTEHITKDLSISKALNESIPLRGQL
jgi:hypothetical protein